MNPFRTSDARDRLGIYLNDHRALIVGELSLARRCRASNTGTQLGHDLTVHIGEVTTDLDIIEKLIDESDNSIDHLKSLAATAGERIGRLKLNGQFTGSSPLSLVVELDGLLAATRARATMWAVLQHNGLIEAGDSGETGAERAASVDTQIDTLHSHLLDASVPALTAGAERRTGQ